MRSTRDIIATLLSNIGGQREVAQYLERFASVESSQFAVIKVGGGILEDHLADLTSALSFLDHVGLTPIVIHGAGPQLTAALERAGVPSLVEGGLRVTTPQVLEHARRVFIQENLRLVEALEQLGTRARPITAGVFEATPLDPDRLGLVGEVTSVHLEPLRSCVRSRTVPVLASLGETASGQILNINADVAARELALRIKPYKIVFLTPTGGLLDRHGRLIPAVNLAEDYERLLEQDWVDGGMRLKLTEIQRILDALPPTSSVSITRPDHLARELFTHRGSGTLVRRGERIVVHSRADEFDVDAVRQLIEACFRRELDPHYFETREFDRVYLSDPLRVAAVLTRGHAGIPYLDKFAVTPEAQGAGLGTSLWHRLVRDAPRLYWRSRVGNPINPWYFQRATGHYRGEDWVVFWSGLSDFDEIEACVRHALSLAPSLAVRPRLAILSPSSRA
ncbi:MAG: acetylglutamate kinase [Myxococcales bacterium]|nr:acetylglutamate kinase [Myxococcales bacterium]